MARGLTLVEKSGGEPASLNGMKLSKLPGFTCPALLGCLSRASAPFLVAAAPDWSPPPPSLPRTLLAGFACLHTLNSSPRPSLRRTRSGDGEGGPAAPMPAPLAKALLRIPALRLSSCRFQAAGTRSGALGQVRACVMAGTLVEELSSKIPLPPPLSPMSKRTAPPILAAVHGLPTCSSISARGVLHDPCRAFAIFGGHEAAVVRVAAGARGVFPPSVGPKSSCCCCCCCCRSGCTGCGGRARCCGVGCCVLCTVCRKTHSDTGVGIACSCAVASLRFARAVGGGVIAPCSAAPLAPERCASSATGAVFETGVPGAAATAAPLAPPPNRPRAGVAVGALRSPRAPRASRKRPASKLRAAALHTASLLGVGADISVRIRCTPSSPGVAVPASSVRKRFPAAPDSAAPAAASAGASAAAGTGNFGTSPLPHDAERLAATNASASAQSSWSMPRAPVRSCCSGTSSTCAARAASRKPMPQHPIFRVCRSSASSARMPHTS